MSLIVALIPSRECSKVQPSHKRIYVHDRKASFPVQSLRRKRLAVSLAGRENIPLLSGLLHGDTASACAAQQGQGCAYLEGLRGLRQADVGHAIGGKTAEVLLRRMHSQRFSQRRRNSTVSLSRGGWLLVVGGRASWRLRSGKVRRENAGSTPRQLRATRWPHPERVGAGSLVSQSQLRQPCAFRTGDDRREYPTRRAGLARGDAQTLGYPKGGAQCL